MATAFMSHAAAALRRGLLLLGVLAIVAGFLGMHIMTGMHSAHAMIAVTSATHETTTSLTSHPAAHAPQAGTTTHDSMAPAPMTTASSELAGHSAAAAPSASCVCQSSCTDPASMHSACVPSAAVTSLAAPPPGMAPASIHTPDPRGNDAVRTYSYLPASPSPGDLSISRT
ncbi:hypothetical protein [Arthrobacter sp. H-02-3]|uniref:hypothetical protein n=1 Tax=Arthrobacter sp. H-02-3 TaxID=2703675 RepID=UPI000DD2957F|nr:hypothetical protein [Arthrobacter sp. H-02-3]PVZ60861.1 hypothetical protein C9424_00185 [Arthrobacter sp. H-02-3]